MSAPVSVQVTGADEVARRFGSLSRDVDDLHSPFAEIADRIAADARAFAPKRTGRLAGGVRPSATARAGGVTVGGVPYAAVQNFGWPRRGIAGSLFMQRAADSKGAASADELGTEVQRQISRNGLA